MKKICVYTICKNEEQFVDKWVASAKDADLLVVGDTGSTDDTINKLEGLGVIVHKIEVKPWRFDVARNMILDLIPKDVDVCISLDLDEVLAPGWRVNLEKAWKPDTTRMGYIYNWSFDEDGKPATTFVTDKIHERNTYKWAHPVHEILQYIGDKAEKITFGPGVQIDHHPDQNKPRSQYLPLLELSVEESPEDDRNVHYLGREYMYYEMWDKSIETLKKHLNLKSATWKDERCASMRYIAKCYQHKGEIQEARSWLYKAIAEAPNLREPYVEMAFLEFDQEDFIGALHMCLEALKITNKSNSYINENYAWDSSIYDICSICYYQIGLLDKALESSKEALKLEPNDERLLQNNSLFKEEFDKKNRS